MSVPLHRPKPVRGRAVPVDRSRSPRRAAERLDQGELLVVTDHFRTGVQILDALDDRLGRPAPDASFATRSAHARALRTASMRLLAPIRGHRVALEGADENGLLAELYPGRPDLQLPLVEVQELHGAWRRYREGVHFATLGHRLHPFYGTYAPTRTEHLELFATWLSSYTGPRDRAVDVGTGCGVLALMLGKAGFAHVHATDSNPNAVESVRRELAGLGPIPPPVTLSHGDLLCDEPGPVDLVTFPPWLHGQVDGLVNSALTTDDDGLFTRFFDQVMACLGPEGRVVMVWSNIMELVQPDRPHPLQTELEGGRLRLVDKRRRKVKPAGGARRRTKERVEIWELARA